VRIIDFTPARRERSRTMSKSSEVSTIRDYSQKFPVGTHTIVFFVSTVVPAKHRIGEVHYVSWFREWRFEK
jgi:hypothetical protein